MQHGRFFWISDSLLFGEESRWIYDTHGRSFVSPYPCALQCALLYALGESIAPVQYGQAARRLRHIALLSTANVIAWSVSDDVYITIIIHIARLCCGHSVG